MPFTKFLVTIFHQIQKGWRHLRTNTYNMKLFCFVIAIIGCFQFLPLHKVPKRIHRVKRIFSIEEKTTISPKICPDEGIYLLIMVPTDISNFAQREVIRQTWGSITKTNKSVKLVFVTGKRDNQTIQTKVIQESHMYSDILQINWIDSYKNLTAKSVEILKWALTCKGAKYILKVDDDMFINLPKLIEYIKTESPMNSIIGKLLQNAPPYRSKNSKWYLSREQYPYNTFPDYIGGTAYVISGDLIKKLYDATQRIPQIPIEDVYITGICRSEIKAKAIEHPGFSNRTRATRPCGIEFKRVISGHHYTVEEIKKIWREIKLNAQSCHT